jgi:ligand-binding SRPBCC domain-containing protein
MRFVKESRIAAPIDRVFAFHETPDALIRLTPPWEKVEIEKGGGSIRPGSRVVLITRFGPFRLRWIAEHLEYDPPNLFADRQVSGPFASWYHRHIFRSEGTNATILRDEIEYQLPLGRLGRVFGGPMIAAKLQRMFDYRHDQTKKNLESGYIPGGADALA